MSDDLSPLARVVLEVVGQRMGPDLIRGCGCASCVELAEEIAQAVVREFKVIWAGKIKEES